MVDAAEALRHAAAIGVLVAVIAGLRASVRGRHAADGRAAVDRLAEPAAALAAHLAAVAVGARSAGAPAAAAAAGQAAHAHLC